MAWHTVILIVKYYMRNSVQKANIPVSNVRCYINGCTCEISSDNVNYGYISSQCPGLREHHNSPYIAIIMDQTKLAHLTCSHFDDNKLTVLSDLHKFSTFMCNA